MSGRNLRLEVILQAVDKITGPLKSAMQGSKGLAQAVKGARDQIKGMEQASARMEAFRQVSRDAAITANQLAQAKDKAQQLARTFAATENPTKVMARELAAATAEAKRLGERSQTLTQKQQRLRAELAAAGTPTRNLAQHQRELRQRVTEASAALERQEQRLRAHGEQMRKQAAARASYDKAIATRDKMAGAGAGMMAAGAATGAPIALSVREYAKAEEAATNLRVAMMRKGGSVPPEFERINALAEQLGNRLPGTTAELQGMMAMLLRQGMSAASILNGLGEATAYIGVQMKMPYEDAAKFSAQLQDATRTTEKDMMSLMDVIQKTYYTGVDPEWMLQGFSKLGAGMDTIGKKGLQGAKELAPLLALANQAGMTDGGSAGNAYRKVFQLGMSKDKADKANAELKDMGAGFSLDFTDGKGEFGGLDKMYAQLAQLKKLSTQDRGSVIKEMFGDDAETLQVLTLMIEKGKAGYTEMQAKMEAQASLQDRVGQQLGTLKNLWDAASGTFTNFLVKMGEAIGPELKAVTEWMGEAAATASNWAKQNPVLANTIMKVAAFVSIALIATGGLAVALAAMLGPLALAKLSMSVLGIKAFALATPLWTLARAALPAVGNAILFIGRALLMNPIGLAVTAIAVSALAIWKYWGPIKAFFAGLWQGVLASTNTALAWISALPARFGTIGSQLMQGMANGITNGLAVVKNAITGAGASAIGWFKEKLGIHSPSRVFAALGGYTMQGLAQGLNDGQASPLQAVMATAKKLTAAGAGLTLGAGVAMAGTLPLDNRPPLSQPGAAASQSAAASPINITVNAAPGMDERALARMVAQEIDKAQRQQAARGRSRLTDRD